MAKTKKIVCDHKYSDEELIAISESQIRFASGMKILSEIDANNAISYERIPVGGENATIVRATIYVKIP